jgi:uncharacterized protein YdhG (YjbR/CyaY superfamily)
MMVLGVGLDLRNGLTWLIYLQEGLRESLSCILATNRKTPKDVDEYISAAPKEMQKKLREVRAAIKEAAPNANESISYGMPFYSYKGKQGVKGRLCYFGLQEAGIGFYLRPPVIDQYMDELAKYASTKSALRFPLDGPMPVPLIKKLVRARMKIDEAGD